MLITRAAASADALRVLVGLPDDGWALRERAAAAPARVVAGMGMTEADGRALRGLLDRLIDELEG